MARAKRKFRIELLSPEDQRVLQQITQSDSTALDEIEKTGKLPDRLASKYQPSELASISNLLAKLPSAKDAFQKFIAQGNDKEADLSDDELQDRIDAFQGLGGVAQGGGGLNPDALRGKIKEVLQTMLGGAPGARGDAHVTDNKLNEIANITADEIVNNRYEPQHLEDQLGAAIDPTFGSHESTRNHLKAISRDLPPIIQKDLNESKFNFPVVRPEDTTADVKRIQDILAERGHVAAKEGEFQNFLVETPKELAAQRRGGLVERQGEASRFLTERFGPRAIAELNRYGLAEGPDVASVIASKAGELQGGIEDVFRQIEAEDNAFFAEAAFRLNTVKLELSESAFRTSVGAERELVRLDQGRRFEKGQNDIQRQFELALLQREADRGVGLKKSELEIGKSTSGSDLTTGLVSDAASNTAQIIAGKIVYGAKGEKGTQPSPRFERLG